MKVRQSVNIEEGVRHVRLFEKLHRLEGHGGLSDADGPVMRSTGIRHARETTGASAARVFTNLPRRGVGGIECLTSSAQSRMLEGGRASLERRPRHDG
jgi:hypothetical protein